MIPWLRFDGEPVRQYGSPAAFDLMDAQAARHATLQSLGTLQESTEGETANLTAVIGIESLDHFDDPPIGAASVQSDRGEQFAGTIKTVTVAAGGITIGIEQ